MSRGASADCPPKDHSDHTGMLASSPFAYFAFTSAVRLCYRKACNCVQPPPAKKGARSQRPISTSREPTRKREEYEGLKIQHMGRTASRRDDYSTRRTEKAMTTILVAFRWQTSI